MAIGLRAGVPMGYSSGNWWLHGGLVLVMITIAAVAAQGQGTYTVLINCGGSTLNDTLGRTWAAEDGYLGDSGGTATGSTSAAIEDTIVPEILAHFRYSTSAFNYSIPVSSKRQFVRLHFALVNANGLTASNTRFSVVAHLGNGTSVQLLSAFNGLGKTGELGHAALQEYSLPGGGPGRLVLAFTPAAGAVAFISGIEVTGRADADDLFTLTDARGQDLLLKAPSSLSGRESLKLMARMRASNAKSILPKSPLSPQGDELGRTWEPDRGYLFDQSMPWPVVLIEPSISGLNEAPHWLPPELVAYERVQTANFKMGYRAPFPLTYSVDVTGGWLYLLRLYFAEADFANTGERVFNIAVNDEVVIARFDIVYDAKLQTVTSVQLLVPINSTTTKIRVAIVGSEVAYYKYNFQINGLEVFKVGVDSLVSPNYKEVASPSSSGSPPSPSLSAPPLPSPPPSPLAAQNASSPSVRAGSRSKNMSLALVSVAVGGVAALVVALACVCCLCMRCGSRGRHKKSFVDEESGDLFMPLPAVFGASIVSKLTRSPSSGSSTAGPGTGTDSSYYRSLAPDKTGGSGQTLGIGRRFTYEDVVAATENFSEDNLLGVGGFGKVYKGILEGEAVAVKRGNPASSQGLHEFRTEIHLLTRLRHRHLVSLIGFCEEDGEMVLVYEYMSGGPLRDHLYGAKGLPAMPWRTRLDILIGAARGLHYLHTSNEHAIIHRDIKSTNILLDEAFTAKVADFGLSKWGPNMDQTHVSTAVKGSFGYLDPEYYRRQQLTDKSDVYSFGVVILEVMCARPVINPQLPREQINIVEWALSYQRRGTLEEVVDPSMKGTYSRESLGKVGEIVVRCLEDDSFNRPGMGDLLWNLEAALALQDLSTSVLIDNPPLRTLSRINSLNSTRTSDSRTTTEYTTTEPSIEESSLETNLASGPIRSEQDSVIETDQSAIFSQLEFPTGR